MNSREAEVFEEDQKRRSTPLCTGWAAVLAEIQCGRREIPADHPDAIRYGKRLESVEEFATRIAHLAASTQSETKEPTREWLIWSNEHRAWWGPNNAGYPKDVHKAGRYTLAEARSICSSRSWDAHGVPPETMIHEIEATRV